MRRLPCICVICLVIALLASAATKNNKAEISRNLDIFNALYKELQTFYVDSIDATKSMTSAIDAMLDDIDPYTEFIPSDKQDMFKHMTTGEYAGIGSMIMKRGDYVIISEPLKGSPAQKAGLRPGDRIVAIDGDSVIGQTTEAVSSKLKGNAGTVVKVMVNRPFTTDSIITFDITRGKIQEQSVPYFGVVRDNIGYITLSQFTDKSPAEIREALMTLKQDHNITSLIFDLRGNGGGLVESAVKILGYFLPKGTEVLRTRGKDRLNEKVYKTTTTPIDTKLPIVVLVDNGTASASEIVSGAMQDLDRAVIVGNRTFGKGLVQTSRPLPYDGLLKVTIAKYFIPSGRLIQAIDYSRRNPDGSVSRIPDSLTHVFHTAAGREVRDGGGITPDLTVNYETPSRILLNLVDKFKVMDYATKYASEHDTLAAPSVFVVNDELFEDFRNFVDPSSVNYDRVLDKMMEQLQKVTEQEGYMTDSVKTQIESLSRMLKHDPNRDFNTARQQIARYLGTELVGRYYMRPGEIEYSLRFDEAVDSAANILGDMPRYRALLTPKK